MQMEVFRISIHIIFLLAKYKFEQIAVKTTAVPLIDEFTDLRHYETEIVMIFYDFQKKN